MGLSIQCVVCVFFSWLFLHYHHLFHFALCVQSKSICSSRWVWCMRHRVCFCVESSFGLDAGRYFECRKVTAFLAVQNGHREMDMRLRLFACCCHCCCCCFAVVIFVAAFVSMLFRKTSFPFTTHDNLQIVMFVRVFVCYFFLFACIPVAILMLLHVTLGSPDPKWNEKWITTNWGSNRGAREKKCNVNVNKR